MNQNAPPKKSQSMLVFLWNHKFTALLTTMLSLNSARLVMVDDIADRFILDGLGAGLFFAATLSLCVEKKSRMVALLLGIPASLLYVIRNLCSADVEHLIQLTGRGWNVVFIAFIIVMILQTLMTQAEVTRDSIAGAFCGYILIGVMFAEVYCLLESIVPNSYQINSSAVRIPADSFQLWLMLEYFSFTTLTTLGFGDVIPLTPAARGLAIWEVICGQFYLAVLVAGLVNLRGSGNTAANR